MTKTLLRSLPMALFATCMATMPAGAATITLQDTFDPTDVFMVDSSSVACTGTNLAGTVNDTVAPSGSCKSLAYTQTLTGYNNPPDVLQSASITVYFNDDGNDSAEKFTLTGDLNSYWTSVEIPGSGSSSSFGPLSVFAQVVGDGILNIFVMSDFSAGRNVGDFYFQKSVLNAEWLTGGSDDEDPLPTPEPASLLLFGAGAVAVAHRIRKSRLS